MKKCDHTKIVRREFKVENWWTGEDEIEVRYVEVCCEEDIDTHRMKCSICGEITYYSGAAKNFYEKGIKGLQ